MPLPDLLRHFPELAGLAKSALLLHPTPEKSMPNELSKIGGEIIWPAEEEWPRCPQHDAPYVSLMQIVKAEIPDLGFRPDSDVFQLVWCPHSHDEHHGLPAHRCLWRSARSVRGSQHHTLGADAGRSFTGIDLGQFVPTQCRFRPEEVIELPQIDELPSDTYHQVCNWDSSRIPAFNEWRARSPQMPSPLGEWFYMTELTRLGGTKIGGYPDWIEREGYPTCRCGRKMQLLLSIASLEPEAHEERGGSTSAVHMTDTPTGLMFADAGTVYAFVCRNCEDYPIQVSWQYS